MKRILIAGTNSYIGTSLKKWLGNYPNQYLVDSIGLRSDSWKENDFSVYDVVFHVAGSSTYKGNKRKCRSLIIE
jgi:nucleoside-diphosphate-sugar epimerase